ncbi:MAG: ABC transporter substrate-binding protein, partial [bacterium]|nr:ABC transporter substrate-binding protein [bacterium]
MYKAIAISILLLSFTGCGTPPENGVSGETRTIADDLGRTVEVPVEPLRIVSTSPEVTESLFAIGAGDKVVGDTVWCDYPLEARELPHIGDFS